MRMLRQKQRLLPFFALALVAVLGLAACGGEEEETPAAGAPAPRIGSVSVIHQWVSGGEPQSFKAVVAPWEQLTGGKVEDLGTRDLLAILTTRVEGGNPPDIAALAAPGTMQKFAREGKLVPLDSFLDMTAVRNEYSQAWIDLCTVDGKLYCVVYKAANKSTVWYNPKVFAANGIQVPNTWDGLMAVSEQLKAKGIAPWSVGVESGGASG
jgi:alpha-glucoside transport system substrate-binding protein